MTSTRPFRSPKITRRFTSTTARFSSQARSRVATEFPPPSRRAVARVVALSEEPTELVISARIERGREPDVGRSKERASVRD